MWAQWGNTQWGSENVLPYLIKLENDQDFRDEFHGAAGPISCRRYPDSEWGPQQHAFYQAYLDAGFLHCPDHNRPGSSGVGPLAFNIDGRTRVSTAIGYLGHARRRENLTIVPDTVVHQVIFEGTRAVGVRVTTLDGDRGFHGTDSMYAITLHQPWASLIALGIKTVETRSWPAPALLVGQAIAIHAGKRVVRKPGVAVENELRPRLGEDWHRTIPAGAVLATAILAGMARVGHINPLTGHAVHDLATETGCAVGLGQTRIDPWADFSIGRWLWLLVEVKPLPEPVPTVGHQSFWHWNIDGTVWRPSETRTENRPT